MSGETRCRVCGQPLSAKLSVERGIGPVCWARLQRNRRRKDPSNTARFEGKNCIYYHEKDENSCHYSMFVRRKCVEGCCPALGQSCDDAEVMHGRLRHATTGGQLGNWEDRDPTPEQDEEAGG